jgi:DNA segregation ATPase FtsK/SpoIIIE-like protein
MSAISSELEVEAAPRNTRVNEIVAIGLIAMALLLGLCLASYNPNDPSWNAAGETGARNWIGAVGANVAAALFQSIGLASYLLPFLIWPRPGAAFVRDALTHLCRACQDLSYWCFLPPRCFPSPTSNRFWTRVLMPAA